MKYDGEHSNAFNYISSKYEFRFNVVTNDYEFRKRKKKKKRKWTKYDDRYKNTILLELMSEHIKVPTEKVNIFIESIDCSPDYNPFDEYFSNIKAWDKKTDYIKKLSKTVDTDSQKDFKKALERFLVGCVDCLLNRDSVNDVCLVFQSGQGLGKTRWMRKLLPKDFRKEYIYEGNIDTRNKDHNMYLGQYWLMHLDELESLRGNDIAALKSYITRQRISERKAYGRYKTSMVRRASFMGSVNDDKFLSDTTGNRRWLVFKVNNVDYMHKIDSNDIWSQAYHLYKNGYRHWFNIEEIKKINERNERFREITHEEELLLRYFTFDKSGKKGEFLSSTEVIQKVLLNIPNFASKMRSTQMGKALAKHSKGKKMKKGIQRYFVTYHGISESEPYGSSPAGIRPGKNEIDEDDDLPF